ncbi:MAG: alpha/beta hydrolase fold protein [Marmoricola sp.]|nr:alpha/beta hydrolase fold protein [Marmoricola sp.]
MSVDIHPAGNRHETATSSTGPKSGPVARIISGSLAAGAAAALVLSLVVFAGGTESVITGSVLIGFAFGWALIAKLTSRYTNRPQRWAFVPAGFMGATGVALVALAPGYDAMTRLSWVWPPVVAVMAGWIFVQVRRSLIGAGRWVLLPVVAVLGLASIGAAYESIAERSDQGTYPAPGKTHAVNGHRMYLDCHGHGGPTVVLFNGMGETSAHWARIAGPIDQTARVCAYDRPGQGWSEETTRPQDGVAAAKDLHTMLAKAGETGPFVLVGHSTGGTYAMTYAHRYPDQVAGMVLLDSSSPYQLTKIAAYSGQYAVMRRGLALLPTLARLGVARLAPAPDLPAKAGAQVQALTSTAKSARNGRDEISVAPRVFAQAQALTTLGNRPLAVLSTTESLTGAGWAGAQDQLAGLSTNRIHRTVHSSHAGLLVDKAPAAQSVRAVTEVLSAVRSGTPLEQQ